MAWDDPSPRKRALSSTQASPVGPGYGAPEVRLSFLAILARAAIAVIIGACVFAEARSLVRDHVAGRHPALDVALPLAVAALAGWLLLRFLLRQPASERGRRGGWWWFGGRRDRDSRYRSTGFGEVVAGEAIGAVIDAALD